MVVVGSIRLELVVVSVLALTVVVVVVVAVVAAAAGIVLMVMVPESQMFAGRWPPRVSVPPPLSSSMRQQ